MPTGEGLFAFRHMEEILSAIDTIEADYVIACRAPRGVAEEYLEATRVCRKFLATSGSDANRPGFGQGLEFPPERPEVDL